MNEPTYLPLLNSIAVNECKGEALLSAWAAATHDKGLAAALKFVSIREGEHSLAFQKRMCELGHEICEEKAFQVFKDFDKLLAFVKSDASDMQKVERLTARRDGDQAKEQKDVFTRFFDDTTIDPETGALLGRYIAEERDSGRRLRKEYDRVCGVSTQSSEIAELRARVDALREEVTRLRNMRSVA
jgi:hypothetical protein